MTTTPVHQANAPQSPLPGVIAAIPIDPTFERLRVHALTIVTCQMARYGNTLTEGHRNALNQACTLILGAASGRTSGRYAIGMPCGAGKTLAVAATIFAAWELGLGFTCAIAANTVRALVLLRRDLRMLGLPVDLIGLRYSKDRKELRAELEGEDGVTDDDIDSTGDDDRPVMLVSHAHIRGTRGSLFAMHKGQPRNILIWDESFLTANTGALFVSELRAACMHPALREQITKQTVLMGLLDGALSAIDAELDAQRRGRAPSALDLVGGVDMDTARRQLGNIRAGGAALAQGSRKVLADFLHLAERRTVSLYAGNINETAFLHYEPAVDPSWSNVVVLDASHPIRLLAQRSGIVDATTVDMRNARRYDKVRVRQHIVAAGKTTQANGKARELAARIVADEVPADEGILIGCFKAELPKLRKTLADDGVDLSARLSDGRPRVNFLTWGRETSSNAFKHCKHVVIVGLFRHNPAALAAMLAGQADDPRARPTLEMELSETASALLQAMHRGACRTTGQGGQAEETTVHLIDRERAMRDILKASMPGMQWDFIGDAEAKPTKVEALQGAIAEYLNGQPAVVGSISVKGLKGAMAGAASAIGKVSPRTWTPAIKTGALRAGWHVDKRSVVRGDPFDLTKLDLRGVVPRQSHSGSRRLGFPL